MRTFIGKATNMKFPAFLLLFFLGVGSCSATKIEWVDFETAVEANRTVKKPFFIDMYTSWCGWCKKMDASTFRNEKVVEFLNSNFHNVKMNPEASEAIAYKGNLYERKTYGKKQYNELAVNLLGGKMSFPTFVILSKKEVRMGTIPGYQVPEVLISKLKTMAKIK
jgi:thioredoxin-related protein